MITKRQFLLTGASLAGVGALGIGLGVRTARSESPLAHGQQAMWFLHQLAPESGAYNVVFTARVRSLAPR